MSEMFGGTAPGTGGGMIGGAAPGTGGGMFGGAAPPAVAAAVPVEQSSDSIVAKYEQLAQLEVRLVFLSRSSSLARFA